jgi:hypothetical protein
LRVRGVLQEYEAQLEPVRSAAPAVDSARGKGEWKVYGNGTRQCKVRVSGLNLPDGAVIQLAVSGGQFAELLVRGGKARYRRESERGEAVPEVEPRQMLQVSYAGQVILEGGFYSE